MSWLDISGSFLLIHPYIIPLSDAGKNSGLVRETGPVAATATLQIINCGRSNGNAGISARVR